MKKVIILEPDDVMITDGIDMKPDPFINTKLLEEADVVVGIDSEGDVQFLKHKSLPINKIMSKTWASYINAIVNVEGMVEVQAKKVLTDTDPMPYGKHKGKPMGDIPASYYHWIWTKFAKDKVGQDAVADYISQNMGALQQEHPDGIWD